MYHWPPCERSRADPVESRPRRSESPTFLTTRLKTRRRRWGTRPGGVIAPVVPRVAARDRTVLLVEDEAEDLRVVQDGERLLHEPSRRPVGRHDQEEAVDPSADDTAVLDRRQGRGVDDDVVVLPPRLIEQLAESRRLEHLVRAGRSRARADDGQVEWRPGLRDLVEGETRVQDRARRGRRRWPPRSRGDDRARGVGDRRRRGARAPPAPGRAPRPG